MKGLFAKQVTEAVAAKILSWYSDHRRDLPWRQTQDPYRIWLSEVILQQTRVAQGLPYYQRFMEAFPDLQSLASATEQEVLRQWQGLGYYSRARNMLSCARQVQQDYHGVFPKSYDELQKLPGIGPYTAAAIASIAYGEPVAVVDGNVVRVLGRLFGIDLTATSGLGKRTFQQTAQSLLPTDRPSEFNQAIMEFGALQCIPRPDCDPCPIRDVCHAYRKGEQLSFPRKKAKSKTTHRSFYYLVWMTDSQILMRQRGPNDIWQGLFDFDLVEGPPPQDVETLGQLKELRRWLSPKSCILQEPISYTHVLSHQRIRATFFTIQVTSAMRLHNLARARGLEPFSLADVELLPKPILIANFLNEEIF